MDSLNNLPPFYVGQKVVALSNGLVRRKGKVYTVTMLDKCKCGHIIHLDNITYEPNDMNGKPITKGEKYECNCGDIIVHDGFAKFYSDNFAPIQESPFPSLTYSKVVEKESELISLN